jgi:hypothetical protein
MILKKGRLNMKKQLSIFILAIIAAISFLHAEEVIKLDFNEYPDGAVLGKDKWQTHMPASNKNASTYTVKKGQLEIIANPAQNLRGGYVEMEIPIMRKGTIEFDLNVNHNQKGTGLFIDLYNISLFWHDYCEDWRRYFPEPTAKRMKYYNVEPVGQRRLGAVKKRKWSHYKIYFDTDNDVVEYYKDDMEDPVYIDGAAAVLGRQEYLGGKLRIGSWGIAKGPMTFLIDNISISSAATQNNETSVKRDRYVIFNGLSYNRYNISESLLAGGVNKKNIRNFYIENPKPALTPANKFFINKMPGTTSMQKAKSLILVDCPFGPAEIIPEFVQKNAVKNVKQGMTLVVFGGLFALGKGEYQDSYLSDYLPVELKDAWQVKKFQSPLIIQPVSNEMKKLDWKIKPSVVYIHDLKPKKDAEVLLTAGDHPLLVRQKLGKGEIIVFLGTTCGSLPKNPQNPLFWKWNQWAKMVDLIVK